MVLQNTLLQKVKNTIGQTAQRLFNATPIGGTINAVKTFQSPQFQQGVRDIPESFKIASAPVVDQAKQFYRGATTIPNQQNLSKIKGYDPSQLNAFNIGSGISFGALGGAPAQLAKLPTKAGAIATQGIKLAQGFSQYGERGKMVMGALNKVPLINQTPIPGVASFIEPFVTDNPRGFIKNIKTIKNTVMNLADKGAILDNATSKQIAKLSDKFYKFEYLTEPETGELLKLATKNLKIPLRDLMKMDNGKILQELRSLMTKNQNYVDVELPGRMGIIGKPSQPTGGGGGATTKVPIKPATAPVTKLQESTTFRIVRASQQVEQDLSQMSQTPPPTGGTKPPQNLSSNKVPLDNIIAPNINVKNLVINKSEEATLRKSVETIRPALEEIRGKTLSNKEAIQAAKTSEMLTGVVNRNDTLAAEAQILRARQQVVGLDKEIDAMAKTGNVEGVKQRMADLVNSLKTVLGIAADTGRKLQSFSIGAKDETLRQQVLKDILKTNADSNKVIEEASKINWTNSEDVVKFYRQFIKPSITDVLTEYRYNNMLSNPRTHLRNAFSNIIQTAVTRPATIAFQGDIKGTAQYYKGAISSLPDAVKNFTTSFKSSAMPGSKYEITKMSTGKLPKFFTIPSRAMEAADKFFSTLIKGGEVARGASPEKAAKTAEYSLFRGDLFPEGQGKLLNAIDTFTAGLYKLRKVPGGDWFVPFLKTLMNVAKQWIEYSPLGVGTLPGAANKKEQLAKSLIGSIVTAVGAKVAFDGLTTWATPTDPKQKQYFYDTGRKPFSININGNWVPMASFGVFAFPLALPAAVKYFQDESRTALTDTDIDKITKIIPGMLNFWSSQTPLSGLGGFVRTLQGDIDYSVAKNLGFTASQLIPFQALVRYLTTALDPVYRKTSGPIQQIQSALPGASMALPPYTDSAGNLSKRNASDYVLPYSTGKANPQFEDLYQMRGEKLQQNAVINKQKKDLENQVNQNTGIQVGAAETSQPTGQSFIDKERAKMQLDLAKAKVDANSQSQTVGNYFVYKDPNTGTVKTIDLSFQPTRPEMTGLTEIDKIATSKYNSQVNSKIDDIYALALNKQITVDEANTQIAKLKTSKITAPKKPPMGSSTKFKMSVKKIALAKVKPVKMPKLSKLKVTKAKKAKVVKAPKLAKIKLLKAKKGG